MQIEFDTSEVVKGQKQVEASFGKIVKAAKALESGVSSNFTKMKEAMKGLRGPTPGTINAFNEFAKALKKYDNLSTNFSKMARDIGALSNIKAPNATTLKNLEKLFQILAQAKATAGISQTSSFLRALGGAANGAVPGFTALVKALNNHNTTATQVIARQGAMVNTVQRTHSAFQGGIPILAKYGSSLGVFQRYALGTTVALQGLMGVLGFREIVQANIALDKIQAALLSVSTSAAASVTNFQFVRNEAMRLGIDLETAAKGYTQLLAASKETTLSTQDVQKLFSQTSEAVRALGLSAVDAEGIFRAFTQIISKGSLQAEELRGQLGDRIPGAVQMFAKAMGVSTEKLGEMMKKGEVQGELLFTSLKKFGDELQKMGAGGLDSAINSMQAAFGRLQISVMEAFREIGKGGFNEAMKDLADGLSNLLQQGDSKTFFRDLGSAAKFAADNIGLIGGALIGLVSSAAFIGLASIIGALGFTIGGLVTGLGVLAGILGGYYLQSAMNAATETQKFNEQMSAVKLSAEALAKGDFDTVAQKYGRVTEALKNLGDQMEKTANQKIAAEARMRAGSDALSTAGGMGFGGDTTQDREATIAAENLSALRKQSDEINQIVDLTIAGIDSVDISLQKLGERYVTLEGVQRKTTDSLKDYYSWTEQLTSVSQRLEQTHLDLAAAEKSAADAAQAYHYGENQSLATKEALNKQYFDSIRLADQLRIEIEALTGTQNTLLGWLQQGAEKFGILLGIIDRTRQGIAAINRTSFGSVPELQTSNDLPSDGSSLSGKVQKTMDDFSEIATTRTNARKRAVDNLEKAYKKANEELKKNGALEEEFRDLLNKKNAKLAEIEESYKKTGKAGDNAFQTTYNRAMDNVRALTTLEATGEETFDSITESTKNFSSAEEQALTNVRNLQLAFKDLGSKTKEFDAVADSIKSLGNSKSETLITKLGEAHVDLEKAIKRSNTALANGELKGKDYDDALKFIEKSTAKAAESSELYGAALVELQKELDKNSRELKNSVEDAELENELLQARISGSDDLSLKVAGLASARANERAQMEKSVALGKIYNELNANEAKIVELSRTATDEMTEAIRLQIETLQKRNTQLGLAAREGEAYYDRLIAAETSRPFLERNAKLAEEARDAWSKPFEEAGKNIFNAFADTFENILDGNTDSFKDFASDILGIFKKLAAQIAALLIFQPVVGGILSGLGFSNEFQRKLGIMDSSSSASGLDSFFGGGGSLSNIVGGGKSLLSNLFGGGTSNTGWSWLDSTLNSTAFGTSPSSFAESGLAIGEISGQGGQGASMGGGMTVGGAIGGAFASAGSIYGAVTNPNIASIGGAIVTTGTTILSALGLLSSTMGPIGMAIGAVLSLVGSLIKKKPSNKGAEFSFNLDEDFTTQFEGDKHPDQMAYVKGFAEPIQNTIMKLEKQYGIARAADATIGANFGIKEGSSFFYDKGDRDGGIENRQIFKFDQEKEGDMERALDELMTAMLKDADWSGMGKRIGETAARDISVALENSAATTLEELLADIDFAANFQSLVELGADDLDPVALALRKIGLEGKTMAASISTAVDEFRVRADSLGLGTEMLENGLSRADQATQGYILTLLGIEAPLDQVASATERANSFIEDLTPILEAAGFSMEQIGHITETVFNNMVADAEAAAASIRQAMASMTIDIQTAIRQAGNPAYQMSAGDLFTQQGLDYSYSGSAGGYGRLFTLVNQAITGNYSALEQVGERLIANQAFLSEAQIGAILNFATSGYQRAVEAMNNNGGGGGDTPGGGTDTGGGGSDGGSDSGADDALRDALNSQIDSLQELAEIQSEAAKNAERLANAFKDSANSLRLYRLGLLVDPSKSPLSLEDQLVEAQRQQADAFARVMAGGEDAVEASKELQTSTDKVIGLSQLVFGSSKQSGDIFRDSIRMLEEAEVKTLNYAQLQLDALEEANLELKRLTDEIKVLQDRISAISGGGSSGGGGSNGGGSNGGGSTPPGGLSPGFYLDSSGVKTQIKFGMESLGRGANESVSDFMSTTFLNYTGAMTEDAAHAWMQQSHPSGLSGVSRLEYYAAARRAGYPQSMPFGSGMHEAWLNSDPTKTLWMAFIQKLNEYTTEPIPPNHFGAGLPPAYSPPAAGTPKQYAMGGLVTGGLAGVDSVPAMLTPGERVFSVSHSQMIEQLASNQNGDEVCESIENLTKVVEHLLSGIQARMEMVELAVQTQTVEQTRTNDGMRRALNSRGEVGESGGQTARRRRKAAS